MPDGTTVTYLYDGTFDGFLTAVFEAYARRRPVVAIAAAGAVQIGFEQDIEPVATDDAKARRVERGLEQKLGREVYEKIWTCFWSCEQDKDTALYRYIRAGFAHGRRVFSALALDDVRAVEFLHRSVTRELQRVQGFARFALMENGVYYARIQPKNNLVPLLTPHFADRYSDMPFLVHDPGHGMAGVYDLQGWYLVESERELPLPELSGEEHEYCRMWRGFYDAIAVQGRISEKRRRGMMPKFYWKNLPEMMPRYAPKQPAGPSEARVADGGARSVSLPRLSDRGRGRE